MRISKKVSIVEPTTYSTAFSSTGELEATDNRTPLDILLEKEDALSNGDETAITTARIEAVRLVLIHCFGDSKNMLEALKQLSLICYLLAPHLLQGGASLDALAKQFDTSRQTFSKRLLKMNKELNVRGRSQKSDRAVEVYREGTKAWHQSKASQKATPTASKVRKQSKPKKEGSTC